MPRTLITGGAGFIGLHLARALVDRGHEVTILDNFSRAVHDAELESLLCRPEVRFERRDLIAERLDDLGDRYHYIVHLAALLGVERVRNQPFEVLSLNHAMLAKALDLARLQKNLVRFLFSSTSEVYAGTLHYFGMPIPTPEDTPLAISDMTEPRTSYMLSKIHGEALCRYSGLPVSIVRFHNAYGPRMGLSHVIPQLLQKAHSLEPAARLEVYSPDHRRTFCYISDVCEFVVRILLTEACEAKTLNIGTEAPDISMRDLGALVLEVAERSGDIKLLPPSPGSPDRRAPAMALTARLTGYQARVDLLTGVRLTYEWYKRNVFARAGVSAI